MKILYLDLDGVLADFEKGILKYCPELDLFTQDEDSYAYRSRKVDEICEKNFRIFTELEFINGAEQAVHELKPLFNIYFLSTPMTNVTHSYMDKKIWLYDKFGEWSYKRLILTHRKDLNIGDFLVDDRLRNGSESFTGEHIHFGTEKFPNWEVTTKYLKERV